MRQCRYVAYIDGSVKLVYSDRHDRVNVSRETITDEDFQGDDAMHYAECARRLAKVKFVDLALCNQWNYFATITLSPKRYSNARMLQSLVDLRQTFNRLHVPYLFVPEYHKKGRIHYHCLLKLNDFHLGIFNLIRGVNPHTGECLSTDNGAPVFNSCYFAEYFGHNTFIPIETITDSVNMSKYVSKYITKSLDKIGKQYYYRSRLLTNPVYKQQLLCSDDIVKALDSYDDYYFSHYDITISDIGSCRYVNINDAFISQRLIAHFNDWLLEDIQYYD